MKSIKQKLLRAQCRSLWVNKATEFREQSGGVIHNLIIKLGSNINKVIRQLLCKD